MAARGLVRDQRPSPWRATPGTYKERLVVVSASRGMLPRRGGRESFGGALANDRRGNKPACAGGGNCIERHNAWRGCGRCVYERREGTGRNPAANSSKTLATPPTRGRVLLNHYTVGVAGDGGFLCSCARRDWRMETSLPHYFSPSAAPPRVQPPSKWVRYRHMRRMPRTV